MSLKLFHFQIWNDRTKEAVQFKGQGEGIAEAWKDGVANVASEGPKVNVRKIDGQHVIRTLAEFEGDIPHGSTTAAPEILDL